MAICPRCNYPSPGPAGARRLCDACALKVIGVELRFPRPSGSEAGVMMDGHGDAITRRTCEIPETGACRRVVVIHEPSRAWLSRAGQAR